MDLSPNDIRNYEFPSQMRGYDKEEVDSLLNQVASALEEMKQENMKVSMELDSVRTQLSGLREFEETIKGAAIDARRNADMTVANAKKEAELILSKAKTEADQIIHTRSQQIADLEDQIAKLDLSKKSYLGKVRAMINSHLDMIDDIATAEIKRELSTKPKEESIKVIDSSEVERDKFESIATQPSESPVDAAEEVAITDEAEPASPTSDTDRISTDVPSPEAETAEEPEEEGPVDPELAAALERYNKPTESTALPEATPSESSEESPMPPPPPKDGFVETSARAEDIPNGFVAGPPGASVHSDTDRVNLNRPSRPDSGQPSDEFKPEDLADELDNIADKFAQEMDKAEHNQ